MMSQDAGTGGDAGMRIVHPVATVDPVPTQPLHAPAVEPAVTTTANWSPSVSPDGHAVAFVSNRSGLPRLWVRPTGHGQATMLGAGVHPVTRVAWSRDGEWLAYGIAPHGAARTEVWIVRPDGTELRQVAGFGDCSATFGAWSHGEPSQLCVASSKGRMSPSKAFLLDPVSGEHTPLATGGLLAALDVTADHGLALVRRGPRSARWVELIEVASGDARRLEPAGSQDGGSTDLAHFANADTSVLLRSDVGRDLAVLLAAPVDGGSPQVMAERADAEVEEFVVSADGRTAVLLWNVYGGRSELSTIDLTTGAVKPLDAPPGEVLNWPDLSPDGRRLCVTAQAPSRPRNIWAVDLPAGCPEPVTYGPPEVVPAMPLSPRLERFRGEDGLELSGWLYRAGGPEPGPTVLYFHGGPEGQDRPVFNPLYRELVSRGISVFAPNVRGSSGFGRRFVNADNVDRRLVALTDVRAAARHVVDTRVADAGRLGCMGRSYGGYLTLIALTWYAELFAVGVDVCGMVDLETFYERTEPWIAEAAYSKYGHPQRDRGLLRELSPIHRIDDLRAPLLVVHGARDTNVPLHEAEQVVAALDARRVPYDLLLFRDEGHQILNTANRAYFVRAATDWLAAHLGV